MDTFATRRSQVRAIIDTDFHGVDAAFAEHIGRAPTVVYRWFTDKEEHKRNIGEKLARHIEKKCGRPPLWLDEPSVSQRTDSTLTKQSGNLPAGEPSDRRESQLVDWYRRISQANKRKLWAQAQLYCLEDDPDAADPFEEAGIPNLLRKENGNGRSGAARRIPRAQHGKGS